jgi:hypothetical protein
MKYFHTKIHSKIHNFHTKIQNSQFALMGYALPQTSVIPRSAEPDPYFAGGPYYLPVDEVDDALHQHHMAIERNGKTLTSAVAIRPLPRRPQQFDPHPVSVSRYSLATAGTLNMPSGTVNAKGNRKKRARNLVELPVSNARGLGAEENKDESTPVEANTFPPTRETPLQFAPPPNFSGVEAMKKYSILAEGAREGGPDYIPCDWAPGLLIQDIPWNQLPLVCALGRPLGFIPTSHVQKVRRAFIHCLQMVAASPYEDLLRNSHEQYLHNLDLYKQDITTAT